MYIQPKEKSDKGTKKRYAAFVVWQGQPTFYLMIKGFQVVRHDSSEAQKEFQTEGLMLNLTEATMEQKLAWAEEWKQRLYSGKLDDKIVMHKGLGKAPDEYKVMPPFLRVGLRLQEEGKLVLHRGERIAYLKVGPSPEQVIAVLPGEKLSLTREQYAYIFDNQFRRIALRLGIELPKEVRPRGQKTLM
jgi:DNA polymerase elongation subunit (family B)